MWVCGLACSQLARACELCIRVGGAWASYVISDHKIILYILDNSERGSKGCEYLGYSTTSEKDSHQSFSKFIDTVISELQQLRVYAQLS